MLAGAAVVVVLILVPVLLRSASVPTSEPSPASVATVVPPRYTAHGQVRPIAQAKVGALNGGTVRHLSVDVGTVVGEREEIARVSAPDGTTEVVTAPWRGTVADVAAHVGDTVGPGATIVTIDDLSQLQVETTDVDEYLLPHVKAGQAITLTVEALDGREIPGRVRTVGIEPRLTATGDAYYPIVVDLRGSTAGLKPGMTTQIVFPP
jgi:multidrug efflux pump subunit AcrA (membrane-fusion protein)